jgi:G3E family GTPase
MNDVISQVKKLNPFAEILPTTFANVDFTTGKKLMKFFPANEKAENGRPNLESVVIKTSRLITSENLECFLKTCISGCIRSKGYINMLSGEKLFLQGSFDDYSLVTADYFQAPTEIVLIGNFQGKENLQKMFENLCER